MFELTDMTCPGEWHQEDPRAAGQGETNADNKETDPVGHDVSTENLKIIIILLYIHTNICLQNIFSKNTFFH